MSSHVDLAFEGPLARLTLRRADKLNALDRPMIDALGRAARAIDAISEVRVAILSGEGKVFCAGGDIAAWAGLPPLEMWRDWTRAGHRAFEPLARLRTPLIVVLTGLPRTAPCKPIVCIRRSTVQRATLQPSRRICRQILRAP